MMQSRSLLARRIWTSTVNSSPANTPFAHCRSACAVSPSTGRDRPIGISPHQQQRYLSSPAAAAAAERPPIQWTTHRLNADQIHKVDKIFHKILWLDVIESQMLMDLLNERLGLKMSPKQRKQLEARMMREEMGDEDAGGEEETPVEAGPVTMDLKLVGFDAKSKIKVIKEVRGLMDGLGLKEAKEMVEGAPITLKKALKEDAANDMKEKLEAVGAQIELMPN